MNLTSSTIWSKGLWYSSWTSGTCEFIRQVAESRTAWSRHAIAKTKADTVRPIISVRQAFSYGIRHVFIVIQWTVTHSSLNHNENMPYPVWKFCRTGYRNLCIITDGREFKLWNCKEISMHRNFTLFCSALLVKQTCIWTWTRFVNFQTKFDITNWSYVDKTLSICENLF